MQFDAQSVKRKFWVPYSVLLLAGLGSVGCMDSPTSRKYELMIGARTIRLRTTEPQQFEEQVIAKLKVVWNDLDSGSSEPFFFRRTDYETASSGTELESPPLRFFKTPSGETGLEGWLDDRPEPVAMFITTNWAELEAELRERLRVVSGN